MKPWLLSLTLLTGSLAVTAILWLAGLPFFFLFLFIPVIPFLQLVPGCPAVPGMRMGNYRQREDLPL